MLSSRSELSVLSGVAVTAAAMNTMSNKFQMKLPYCCMKSGEINVFRKEMYNYFLLLPHPGRVQDCYVVIVSYLNCLSLKWLHR